MKKKILVVDDEVSITKIIKLNLEYTEKYEQCPVRKLRRL